MSRLPYDEAKVLEVACPRCGAQPGEPCVAPSGKRATSSHMPRRAIVYPRFGVNRAGVAKQGTTGNIDVYLVEGGLKPAIIVAKTEVGARERYKVEHVVRYGLEPQGPIVACFISAKQPSVNFLD